MPVTGLSTILVRVSNMERALAFYSALLEQTPISTTDSWTSFLLPGGITLGLHSGGLQHEPGNDNAILGFAATDLVAIKTRLLALGARIVTDFHEVPGGRLIAVADPDGNVLQVIERG